MKSFFQFTGEGCRAGKDVVIVYAASKQNFANFTFPVGWGVVAGG